MSDELATATPRVVLPSLALEAQTVESLARVLEGRGEIDAARTLRLALVQSDVAAARNFRHGVRLGQRDGRDEGAARLDALARLEAPAPVLHQLLREFARVNDDVACAHVLERLAAGSVGVPDRLREAAAAYQRASAHDDVARVLERACGQWPQAARLGVRDYLAWTELLQGAEGTVPPGLLARLDAASAESLLRHPEFETKRAFALARQPRDAAALALARAALGAGQDIAWMSTHYKARDRRDMLAELQELAARAEADPVPLLLRAARAWETAGRPERADTLYAEFEPEIAAHRTQRDKAATQSTLMFRNLPVLDGLVRLIGAACASRSAPLRVHVAAASTGEEAYSLAIALHQAGLLERVALEGSDIDPQAVARARRGIVARRLLAKAPPAAWRHFEEQSANVLGLDPQILRSIDFFAWNLLDDECAERRCDILVANNLSVHLMPADKQRLIAQLARHSAEHGIVVMGGDVHDAQALAAIAAAGLHPVHAGVEACHEAWTLQRQAWYMLPRPYWALPPFRAGAAGGDARFATFFARSAAALADTERHLAAVFPPTTA